jgi:hypothetical protein
MYSIGSIAGVSIIVAGGAAGVGTICLCIIGSAVADICSYLTARAHFDRPSTSSTSFNRFLCLSTVLASSWSDGERSAPLRLSWCLSPNPACSCFSTAVNLASKLVTLSSVDPCTADWHNSSGYGRVGCYCTMALVFSFCSRTIIRSTNSVTRSSRWTIWFYWDEFTSFYSTMSICSCVTAAFSSFRRAVDAWFLSAWSYVIKVWVSCISFTFVSSLFPAAWICLMEFSASSFHFLSVFCSCSRPLTNWACVLKFCTTSAQNLCTSSNCYVMCYWQLKIS